jgi:hypothetical protein
MRGRLIHLVAAVAVLVALSPAAGAVTSRSGPPAAPTAVVGIVDTGINPYHRVFRDRSPQAYQYPGSYLPGYPKGATALHITLDATDYYEAVSRDCEQVWSKVRPGQLYWFPGTKIVGAISFGSQPKIKCNAKKPGDTTILSTGHGTMTASRAVSTQYGGCRECRVVSVQLPMVLTPGSSQGTTDTVTGIRWAAANAGWLDAQSNSWGPIVPAWAPTSTGLAAADPELVRAIEETSQRHLAFYAAGNGVAFRFGVVGHPTLLAPHLGPSPIIVGGTDSGFVSPWPGSTPTVASDDCNSWATDGPETIKSGDSVGSGTSAATPYVAGGAARVLLEARRILGDTRTGVRAGVVAQGRPGLVRGGPLADGRFTMAEWRDLVLHTATARPMAEHDDGPPCDAASAPYQATPVKWSDVPAQFPAYLLIGYGAVDTPAKALAFKVLQGKAPMPSRPDEDRYRGVDQQLRAAFYQAYEK